MKLSRMDEKLVMLDSTRGGRLGSAEMARFILSIFIMSYHIPIIGLSRPLVIVGWAWVDYFFILTGFFTAKHFSHLDCASNCGQVAMHYTIQKIKKLMPFVTIALTARYFIEVFPYLASGNIKTVVKQCMNLPYELLLLSSSGLVETILNPIWFLSAMLLTLPLLIYLMKRFEELWYICSWLIPVLYYGKNGINTVRSSQNDLLRAFCCMALGTFVYMLAIKLQKMKICKYHKVGLTLLEVASFGGCTLITVLNIGPKNILVLLFVTNMAIMLSGCSYTSAFHGAFFDFLGDMSVVIFLFHWIVGVFVKELSLTTEIKVVIYYVGTVCLSGFVYFLHRFIKLH